MLTQCRALWPCCRQSSPPGKRTIAALHQPDATLSILLDADAQRPVTCATVELVCLWQPECGSVNGGALGQPGSRRVPRCCALSMAGVKELNGRGTAIGVFALLCVACLAHSLYYYSLLPDQVAHHFGISGEPDAWGSKTTSLISHVAIVAFMAVTFLGICFAMARMPDSMINLPNKDYWLAPEHRQQTMHCLQSRMLWMGSLTIILLIDTFHQSYQVALGNATRLGHFWLTLGAYLALTTVWCVALLRRFRKPDPQQES